MRLLGAMAGEQVARDLGQLAAHLLAGAADAGWETWYVPASEAVHEGMGSARGQYNVEKRKQTSRRKYWIKHHGRAWYYSLVGALAGRYALYAGVAAGAVVLGRKLLR